MSTTLQMQHLDTVAAAQGARSEDITTVNERLQDPLGGAPVQGPRLPLRPHRQRGGIRPRTDRRRRRQLSPCPRRPARATSRTPSTTRAPCPPSSNGSASTASAQAMRQYSCSDDALDAARRAARRARPEVRPGPRPPPPPSARVRPRRHRSSSEPRPPTLGSRRACTSASWPTRTTRIEAILTDLLALPEDRAADHHPPGRRGPVAAVVCHGPAETTPTGPPAPPRRARAEVRDPQRLVPAGRRGSSASTRR